MYVVCNKSCIGVSECIESVDIYHGWFGMNISSGSNGNGGKRSKVCLIITIIQSENKEKTLSTTPPFSTAT